VASVRNWDFAAAPPMGNLAAYVGVTALAVAGYGAVFLPLGLFCRNSEVDADSAKRFSKLCFCR